MKQIRRIEVASLVSIIVLAAFLRLGYPGINPFASDEATLSVLALEMGREGHLARTGISNSAGSRNLPASVYVLLPPYTLSSDPLIATQYIALLNVIAVLGIWWVGRRCIGSLPALISTLFAAAAPYAVFFSRNIWAQNLLLPLAVGWLAAVVLAQTTSNSLYRKLAIGLAAFIAGFTFQIHLAGAALGLASVYVFFRWRWWRNLIPVLVGGSFALLTLLPFFYEAYCCSPELIRDYTASSGASTLDLQAMQMLLKMSINRGWDYLAAGDLARYGNDRFPIALAAALLLIGLVGMLKSVFNKSAAAPSHGPLLELLIVLPASSLILFSAHQVPVRLHYLLIAFPAVALLIGLATELFKNRFWTSGITIATLTLAILWSNQIIGSLGLASQQAAPMGMNTPLKARRDVAYNLPDDNHPVVMHTQSPNYYQRGEPAMWKVLLWDRPHQITNGWSVLLLPDEPAYLMTEISGIHAWQEMRDTGIMDDQLIRYDPLPGAQPHFMQPYDGARLPEQVTRLDEPVLFDTGLQLLGWYTRHVDGQLRISMLYEALTPPPDDLSLRQFTHVREAADVEAGNIGAPTYSDDIELTIAWQQGDRLIAIAAVTPQEDRGAFYVDIGQYSLDTGVRYSHSGGSDFIRFGPFDWSRE